MKTPVVFQAFGRQCARFFRWVRETLDMLCDRPDHLQRISIIMAGMSLFPLFLGTSVVLVFFALRFDDERAQIIGGLINYGYVYLALFALVIVAMLGTIKGIRLSGPGGSGITLVTTADDPDVDPNTTRDVDYGLGGGKSDKGGSSGFGHRPFGPSAEGDDPPFDMGITD